MALIVDTLHEPDAGVTAAVAALRAGGVVIFPTETFYGLAVMPQARAAVERLVRLKSRLPHKPIPLIACDEAACLAWALLPAELAALCAAFWPGPLTLVLEPRDPAAWPESIIGEHKTLGVRVSSHPIACALAAGCGGVVTATSANFASEAAVMAVGDLDPELVAQVDVVLDGGALPGGMPSTVLRVQPGGALQILRPGAVSQADIAQVVRR